MFRRARLSVKPNVRPGAGGRAPAAPEPPRGQQAPREPEPAAPPPPPAPEAAETPPGPPLDPGGAEPLEDEAAECGDETPTGDGAGQSSKSSMTVLQRRKRISTVPSLTKSSAPASSVPQSLGTVQEEAPQPSPLPVKEKQPCSDRYRILKAQKLREMLREEMTKRRQWKNKYAGNESQMPPDRSKMTMRDLIYYLPDSNPMKSSLEQEAKAEKSTPLVQTKDQEEKNTPDGEDDVEEMEEESNDGPLLVPRVKVAEDGSIILDEESLTVEVLRTKGPCVVEENDPIFERGSTTTYSSFRKNYYSKPWSNKETDMFFLAISMVGTDFSMIGQLFPHRARIEIKNKFKREEKTNGWRIDKAFQEKRPFDFDFFARLLEKVLAEEEKRKQKTVKNQNAKEKKSSRPRKKQNVNRVASGEVDDDPDDSLNARISDMEGTEMDAEIVEKENDQSLNTSGQTILESVVNRKKRKRKKKDDTDEQEAENLSKEATDPSDTSKGEKPNKKKCQLLVTVLNGDECNKDLEVSNLENLDEIICIPPSENDKNETEHISSTSIQDDTATSVTAVESSEPEALDLSPSKAKSKELTQIVQVDSNVGGKISDTNIKLLEAEKTDTSKPKVRGRPLRPKPNLLGPFGKKAEPTENKIEVESKNSFPELPGNVEKDSLEQKSPPLRCCVASAAPEFVGSSSLQNLVEKDECSPPDINGKGVTETGSQAPEAESHEQHGLQETNKASTFRPARLLRGRMQRPEPHIGRTAGQKEVLAAEDKTGTKEEEESEPNVTRGAQMQTEDQSFSKLDVGDSSSKSEKEDVISQKLKTVEPETVKENQSLQDGIKSSTLKRGPVMRTRFQKPRPNIGKATGRGEIGRGKISAGEKAPKEISVTGKVEAGLRQTDGEFSSLPLPDIISCEGPPPVEAFEKEAPSPKEISSPVIPLKPSCMSPVEGCEEDKETQSTTDLEQISDVITSKCFQDEKLSVVKKTPFMRSRFKRPRPNLGRAVEKSGVPEAEKCELMEKMETGKLEIMIQHDCKQDAISSSQDDAFPLQENASSLAVNSSPCQDGASPPQVTASSPQVGASSKDDSIPPQSDSMPHQVPTSPSQLDAFPPQDSPPPQITACPLQDDISPLQDDASPLQVSVSPLQGKASSLQDNASSLQGEVFSLQDDASPLQGKVSPLQRKGFLLQGEAFPLQSSASPLQDDVCPLKSNASSLQDDASPLQGSASPCQGDASPCQGEAFPLEGEASPLLGKASPLQVEVSPLKDNASILQGSASPFQDEAFPLQGDDSPLPGKAFPLQGDVSSQDSTSPPQVGAFPAQVCSSPQLTSSSLQVVGSSRQDDASVCQDDASVCQDDASVCQDDASVCQDDASVCQDDASVCQDDASIRQDDASVPQDDVIPPQNNASPPQINASSPQNNAFPPQMAAFPTQDDASPFQIDASPLQVAASSLQVAASSLQVSASHTQVVTFSPEDDAPPVQVTASCLQGAALPIEDISRPCQNDTVESSQKTAIKYEKPVQEKGEADVLLNEQTPKKLLDSMNCEPEERSSFIDAQENNFAVSTGIKNSQQEIKKNDIQPAPRTRGRFKRPRPNISKAERRDCRTAGSWVIEERDKEEGITQHMNESASEFFTLPNSKIESEVVPSEEGMHGNKNQGVSEQNLQVSRTEVLNEQISKDKYKPHTITPAQLRRSRFQTAKSNLGRVYRKKEEPGTQKIVPNKNDTRKVEDKLLQQGDSDAHQSLKDKTELLSSLGIAARKECVDSRDSALPKECSQSEQLDSFGRQLGSAGHSGPGATASCVGTEEHFLNVSPRYVQQSKELGCVKNSLGRRIVTSSTSECEMDSTDRRVQRKSKQNFTKGRGSKRVRGRICKKEPKTSKAVLVTLRASQEEDEEDIDDLESEYEEENYHLAPEEVNKAPVFVPIGLRSPEPISPQIEETMEELEISVNVPDVACITIPERPLSDVKVSNEGLNQEQNLNASLEMTTIEYPEEETGISDGSTEAAIALLSMGHQMLQSETSPEEIVCVLPEDDLRSHISTSNPETFDHRVLLEHQVLSSPVPSTLLTTLDENKNILEEQNAGKEMNLPGQIKEHSTPSSDQSYKKISSFRTRSRFPKPKPNISKILGKDRHIRRKVTSLPSTVDQQVDIQSETGCTASKEAVLEDISLESKTMADGMKQASMLTDLHSFEGTDDGKEVKQIERGESRDKESQESQMASPSPLANTSSGDISCNLTEAPTGEFPSHDDDGHNLVMTRFAQQCTLNNAPEAEQQNVVTPDNTAVNLVAGEHQGEEEEQTFILTLVEIPTDSAEQFAGLSDSLTSGPLLPAPILVKPVNKEERGDVSLNFPVGEDTTHLSSYGNSIQPSPDKPATDLDVTLSETLGCSLEESTSVVAPTNPSVSTVGEDCQKITSEVFSEESTNAYNNAAGESYEKQTVVPILGSTCTIAEPPKIEKEQSEPTVQTSGTESSEEVTCAQEEENVPHLPQDETAVSDEQERSEATHQSEQRSKPSSLFSRPGRRPLGFLSLICSKNNLESEEATPTNSQKRLKPLIPVSRHNVRRPTLVNESKRKKQDSCSLPPTSAESHSEASTVSSSAPQVSCDQSFEEEKCKSDQKMETEEEPTKVTEYFFSDIFMEVDETEQN
ncbi:transcription factor TFIIIB component B'' homolog isoform X1 [Notamacropus eugenii]|uniref:transcription factor TFIIIB component B'' homolog isoform X1 n=1 Tax=Notamacropus eugenii TaxID=9315 RepID=UPI003B66D9F1